MTVEIKDGAAAQKYLKSTGAGSAGDPYIPEHLETNSAAIKTAVETMDDWDETDRAKANIIVGQAGVAANSGVVSATTQRVVLATDVALPAGTNAIGKLSANSGVDIGDVDVTTVVPGTGATSLGKAEDAAHTTGDTGVAVWAVRKDTAAALAGTDGDYAPLEVDASGRLHVVVGSIAAGTTNIGDVDVLTLPALPAGTNNIGDVDVLTLPGTAAEAAALPSLFVVVAADDGVDTQPLQLDASGNLKVNIQAGSSAGTEYIEGDVDATIGGTAIMWEDTGDTLRAVSAAKPLPTTFSGSLPAGTNNIGDVDVLTLPALPTGSNAIGKLAANSGIDIGDVDVTSIIPGTGATNQGKAEDAVHASGDTGVFVLSVRKDTAASTAGTDGDYAGLITDANGRLHTIEASAAARLSESDFDTKVGALTETAPATDTASSGLNGRLQRIAQRITSLIALVPSALTGSGNFKTALQEAIPAGTNNIGDVDVLTLPALATGTNRIGTIGTDDGFVEVTPTLDTSAYTAGDTLFAATQVASVPVSSGRTVVLESITVVDKDDQGIAFDLHFFDRSVTFGTANAAPSINDTDAAFSMGWVPISSNDYKDLGANRVACVRGIGLQMKPNATDLYIGGVTGGTPTHTASGMIIKLGFLRS